MANIARLIAEFPDHVKRQMAANGQEAAAYLEDRLKANLGRQYPPASRRGEYPARRSGRLQREAYARAEVRGDSVVINVAEPTPYAEKLSALGRRGPRSVIEDERRVVEDILLRKGYVRR